MRRHLALLGLAAALSIPTAAAAAPGWVPAIDQVTPPVNVQQPVVAVVTPDLRTVAFWAQGGIRAAVRPRGGTFGEPFVVDASPSETSWLDAVALPNGDVMLAWSGLDPTGTARVKVLRPDGSVADARPPESPAGVTAIDANAAGMVAVAYYSGTALFLALRPAGATVFDPPVQTTFSRGGNEGVGTLDVTVRDDGQVAVAVGTTIANPPGGTARVAIIRRSPAGVITTESVDSQVLNISPPAGTVNSAEFAAEIELLADGRQLLAYRLLARTSVNGTTTFVSRQLRVGPRDGSGGAQPLQLDQQFGEQFGAKDHGLVVDDQGRPSLWWRQLIGASEFEELRVSRGTTGGVFTIGAHQALASSFRVIAAAAPFGAGRTGLLFMRDDVELSASISEAGAAFGPPATVATPTASAISGTVVLAGAGEGSAVALWRDGTTAINATAFDATPPSAPALQLPNALTAGLAGAFAATANDDWSAPTISWRFGDGVVRAGGTVQHAFGAAGRFDATATATDAVGNTATSSGSVTVAPAPDTRAPALTNVRLVPATLVRPRTTTHLRVRLDERATVVAQLERARPGFIVGRRCLARRPSTGTIRRCTRWVRSGVPLRRSKPVGAGALLIRRPAVAGRYRVAVYAVDAAGNRSPVQRRGLVVR